MKKFKILDYDYGCGGLSKGFEDTGKFEVVCNPVINDFNRHCYNKVHSNTFDDDSIIDDVDLMCFTPDFKTFAYDKKKDAYDISDLMNILEFIDQNKPENLLIYTKRESFAYLQSSKMISFMNFGRYPTKDIINSCLQQIGYNIFYFVIDEAGFGLPQHDFFCFYFASLNEVCDINVDEVYGIFKKDYRTPKDVLFDITDESNLSWHKVNYKKKEVCAKIPQGSSARLVKDISQKHGYHRLKYNEFCSTRLARDFYVVSSHNPSIHPLYDRPLTIREGARMFGLSDDFDWDSKLSQKIVADMIFNSFSPYVAEYFANSIYLFLK